MATAPQERPQPDASFPGGIQPDATWDEHYSDERDAAFLYRQLAGLEPNEERRDLFERLARVRSDGAYTGKRRAPSRNSSSQRRT